MARFRIEIKQVCSKCTSSETITGTYVGIRHGDLNGFNVEWLHYKTDSDQVHGIALIPDSECPDCNTVNSIVTTITNLSRNTQIIRLG